jgi:hypothetical protein
MVFRRLCFGWRGPAHLTALRLPEPSTDRLSTFGERTEQGADLDRPGQRGVCVAGHRIDDHNHGNRKLAAGLSDQFGVGMLVGASARLLAPTKLSAVVNGSAVRTGMASSSAARAASSGYCSRSTGWPAARPLWASFFLPQLIEENRVLCPLSRIS